MTQGFDHSDIELSRCRICRRPFGPLELDEDILRNLGACESCAQEEYDHEDERRAELAGDIVAHLPLDMTWTDRFCAMMIAILGCADSLDYNRPDVVAAFGKLAAEVKELEIDGLKELFGDG